MAKRTYEKPKLQVVILPPCRLLAGSDIEGSSSIEGWQEGDGDSHDFEI